MMKYEVNPDVVSTELDDTESVLLNLKTRAYFTLNETGSVIWNGAREGKSIDEITEDVVEQFDIELADARSHVEDFLAKLVAQKILMEQTSDRQE